MKIAVAVILGFALGFATHFAIFARRPTAEQHWRALKRHNAYMRNPANYRMDPSTGLSSVTPPGDPLPHLAALVAAGELTHADLVLPTVPKSREAARHWLAFCETHQEIVYATGNPSYSSLTLKGTQPLHLNLWFRYEDKAVVQTLVRQLEEKFAK